jgi:cold shock CspA family protein
VQATVATFADGAGTVLTDTGERLAFDAAAFAAGGLRLLRSGQRVRVDTEGDRIVRITLATLPWPSSPCSPS